MHSIILSRVQHCSWAIINAIARSQSRIWSESKGFCVCVEYVECKFLTAISWWHLDSAPNKMRAHSIFVCRACSAPVHKQSDRRNICFCRHQEVWTNNWCIVTDEWRFNSYIQLSSSVAIQTTSSHFNTPFSVLILTPPLFCIATVVDSWVAVELFDFTFLIVKFQG